MSFNDLERGTSGSASQSRSSGNNPPVGHRSGRPTSTGPLPLYHAPRSATGSSSYSDDNSAQDANATGLTPEQRAEFKRLADSVGTQIFKITSNTQAIQKLVRLADQQQRSSAQDRTTTDWTKRAHELVESTRAVVKSTTPSLKSLSTLILTSDAAPSTAQFKLTLSRLQRDFEAALQGFAEVQKQSARKSKEDLEGARKRAGAASSSSSTQQLVQIEDEEERQRAADETAEQVTAPQQQQQQQQQRKQTGPSAAELEFQETLISEREAEIREIESGIHELNEIFRDLGAIVQEQGGMIDNIEYNINEIAVNTQGADRELDQASEYQRKSGKRAACLLLIVGFVVAVVLVAILS